MPDLRPRDDEWREGKEPRPRERRDGALGTRERLPRELCVPRGRPRGRPRLRERDGARAGSVDDELDDVLDEVLADVLDDVLDEVPLPL